MPIIVATITPEPQHRAEVRDHLAASLAAVHREPGCLKYALHECNGSFILIEQWASPDDLDRHSAGDAVREVSAAIGGKLAEPIALQELIPIVGGEDGKGEL